MENSEIKKLTAFFYEIGNLRRVLRAHQQMLLALDPTDNIASHSFRVAFIGYFLAKELDADADKVFKMCLIHDLEEIRTSDQNWVHKKYVKAYEAEVRRDQLEHLSHADELLKLSDEYEKRETQEAKITKDADLLDQIFLLREYAHQGNKEAARWLKGEASGAGIQEENEQEKKLSCDLAKKIAKEAKSQEPSFWWENAWTSDRRE